MKDQLLKISDEILIKLAKGEISPKDNLIKIAIFIKETLTQKEASEAPVKTLDKSETNNMEDEDKFPEMLKICLRVFNLMKLNEYSFSKACSAISEMKGVRDSTVRQACCKNLKLKAFDWNQYYLRRENSLKIIQNALLKKYPHFANSIKKYLS